jgi:hypothetical protein
MLAAGTIAAMIYNVNRGKDDRALEPMDFVPPTLDEMSERLEEPDEEIDIEALSEFLGARGKK